MPDYKITVSDEGDKVLQKALTAQNAHLEAQGEEPYETMDDFLTDQIEAEFGISDEELAASAKQEAIDAIVAGMKDPALTADDLAGIAETVKTTIITKQPGGGGKLGGPILQPNKVT